MWFAEQKQQPVATVASVYFKAYEQLGIDWLLAQTQALPQDSYWDRRATQALRSDIMATFRRYASEFLTHSEPLTAIDEFVSKHAASLAELQKIRHGSENGTPITLATLSVLLGELKDLLD